MSTEGLNVMYVCRAGLEEELDVLRVQAAMDRASVKELHTCLTNNHRGKASFNVMVREDSKTNKDHLMI